MKLPQAVVGIMILINGALLFTHYILMRRCKKTMTQCERRQRWR